MAPGAYHLDPAREYRLRLALFGSWLKHSDRFLDEISDLANEFSPDGYLPWEDLVHVENGSLPARHPIFSSDVATGVVEGIQRICVGEGLAPPSGVTPQKFWVFAGAYDLWQLVCSNGNPIVPFKVHPDFGYQMPGIEVDGNVIDALDEHLLKGRPLARARTKFREIGITGRSTHGDWARRIAFTFQKLHGEWSYLSIAEAYNGRTDEDLSERFVNEEVERTTAAVGIALSRRRGRV
jgi:hypothetical protein